MFRFQFCHENEGEERFDRNVNPLVKVRSLHKDINGRIRGVLIFKVIA